MLRSILLCVVFVALAACAGGTAPVAPSPRGPAADRIGDPQLHEILDSVPLGVTRDSLLHAYELEHARDFLERVSLIAEDPAASVPARYNAVRLLGERGAAAYSSSLRIAASDPDLRVRSAVVVAAGRISEATRQREGRSLLIAALEDSSPEVQAKALEVIGLSDPELLRSFLARHPRGEVSNIALMMLQTAEDRGAPLAPDSMGVLRRTLPNGTRLEFRPAAQWPQWQAALGALSLAPVQGPAVRIDSVEVVRNVVPAFFSPDVRHVVYERQRTIFVRELATGSTREVGKGIAPRPRPFSGDFVYLREVVADRTDLRERTRVRYEVLSDAFAADSVAPQVLGAIGAFTQHDRSGEYSPARWMRVVGDNAFSLQAEQLETFQLPDPFKGGSRP